MTIKGALETAFPPAFAEAVSAIGTPAALRLVDHYGGTRLYVPQELCEDWPVAAIIGGGAAAQLVARCRSTVLWIPRCVRVMRTIRDTEIRQRHAAGEKVDPLAREYGLTDRTVWYIVSRAARDSRQTSLF